MKYENYELKKTNTFQVGGKARWFLKPESIEECKRELSWMKGKNIPFRVIGHGSNLLISDKGFDGAIMVLKELREANEFSWLAKGQSYVAGAFLSLKKISNELVKTNCPDFIKLSGIPGTLGGAVKMNAGCYGEDISNFIEKVEILKGKDGLKTTRKDELNLSYRSSGIREDDIIISAVFSVKNFLDEKEIKREIKEMKEKRSNQPLGTKNAGSVFKNGNDYVSAKLIDDAGLKGLRVGDAEVSEKHANFIVNKGKATALEIFTLMKEIEEKVFTKFGVKLEREVELIGDFN